MKIRLVTSLWPSVGVSMETPLFTMTSFHPIKSCLGCVYRVTCDRVPGRVYRVTRECVPGPLRAWGDEARDIAPVNS